MDYIFISQVVVVALALIACVASKPTVFTFSSSSPHAVDSVLDEPYHHYSSAYIAPYTHSYDGHGVYHSGAYPYDSHHDAHYGFDSEIYDY